MKKFILSLGVALGLSTFTFAGHSTSEPTKTPSEIMKELITQDSEFAKEHHHDYFSVFQNKQSPYITMITCSDARVHENILEKDPINKIFSIRNIGNQLLTSFGSVDYGVYHLHTPVLLILGHTHCGAVKAALGDYRNESFDIIKELDHLFIPLKDLKGTAKNKKEFEKIWIQGVERNVDYQVEMALKKYKKEVKEGKLTVIGAVDDFINAYKSGEGRIIIINVNDEKNVNNIKKMKLFKDLSPKLKALYIKRITN